MQRRDAVALFVLLDLLLMLEELKKVVDAKGGKKNEGLELKIREQEALINQLTQKAESATTQVESIACRALGVSVQRFNGRLLPDERDRKSVV